MHINSLDRIDWKLNPMIFQEINNLYGPIDVDQCIPSISIPERLIVARNVVATFVE